MSRLLLGIPDESGSVLLAAGQPGPQQTLSRSVDEVGQGEGGRRKAEVGLSSRGGHYLAEGWILHAQMLLFSGAAPAPC